ncbi:MAG: DUF190 domain-containing protein [Cyanobacteria bacterium J06638_20]
MTTFKKLSIYTSEGSRLGTRPLHSAIIATALEQEIYSAIAIKAMEGFGPQLAIPTANRMALESDRPIEVRLLDQPAVIEDFIATFQDMLASCIVTVEEVEVVQPETATMAESGDLA